jgi:membrane protein implicated in regulation of membrane protease activity
MYGSFSGISFAIVAGVALLVIALAFFASPLLAVVLAAIAAVVLLMGMAAMRRRSRAGEQGMGSEPGTGPAGPRARGTSGSKATGAPASGEGDLAD